MEQNGPGSKRDRSRTNIPDKAPLFEPFLFSMDFIWHYIFETFEKCSILSKAKEGENFNHRCPAGNALGVNTFCILRIKI
jgi:hypothetical protein